MPLPYNRGLIARLLQQFGKGLLIPVKDYPVHHEPIQVTVLSRLDHRPARTANGVRHIAAIEFHPLLSDTIHVRRRHPAGIIGAQRLLAMVVRKDENDVRAIRALTETSLGKNEPGSQEQYSKG